MTELLLVLGGTRSGKSGIAEALVASETHVTYVGTAQARDDEMRRRIKAHQQRRPPRWTTVETDDLATAVAQAAQGSAVLIDGLGGWLTARMDEHRMFDPDTTPADDALAREVDALLATVAARPGAPVVIVAEEVGMSLVPTDPGARRWIDLLGETVQRLSQAAARVLLVHAGRVVELQSATTPAAAGDVANVALRAHGDTMVAPGALDFAVNVHGGGPPEHLRRALADAVNDTGRYPDETAAITALAERHQRPTDQVLATAGAAEAFWLLARVVAARHPVVVHPQFTEPEAALRAAGMPVTHVIRRADQNWMLDLTAVPDDADLVVIGAPNNPTGTLDDPELLAALCRPGRVTVIDEAFIDFVPDAEAGLAHRSDLEGLVVVRSVTKLWGLAGLRSGYLLGPAGLLRRCAAGRQPWAVSGPALRALEVCAGDEEYRAQIARMVANWRAMLLDGLRQIPGVTAWNSAANFVLLHLPQGAHVQQRLAAAGIAVRPSTFVGLTADHLRVAVRPPAMTERLLAELRVAVTAS